MFTKYTRFTVYHVCVTVVTSDRQRGKSIVAGTGFRNKTVDTCATTWMLFWMCWETGSNCQPRWNQYVISLFTYFLSL